MDYVNSDIEIKLGDFVQYSTSAGYYEIVDVCENLNRIRLKETDDENCIENYFWCDVSEIKQRSV